MNKIAKFADKYDIILFDMDGVITSEDNYWTSAALATYETVKKYFSAFGEDELCYLNENPMKVREEVFANDKTISLIKNMGVNSNWDLAYVCSAVALILKTDDWQKVHDYIKNLDFEAFALYKYTQDELVKTGFSRQEAVRLGTFWNEVCDCFQQWYLGDKLYLETYGKEPAQKGKEGLIYNETPLLDYDKLDNLLKTLKASDKKLGVATGRLSAEIIPHFEKWGFTEYFDKNRIISYSLVTKAEDDLKATHASLNLTKPHPYMFLKGALGIDYPDEKIVSGEFDKTSFSKVLAVGDAGADMFSAQSAGIDFAAVLTGVAGKSAENYFKEHGATYILDSVLDFLEK